MQVIYLDVLAGVNLAMDCLLLGGTARLAGIYASRGRLLLGGAAGAAYAVLTCLPGLELLGSLPAKAACGLALVRLTFGRRRAPALIRLALLFWLLSCACAGGALALGQVSGASFFAGGGYYVDVPLRVVAAAAALSWALAGLIFRGQGGDGVRGRQTARVRLDFAGQSAEFTLLVDSGNELSDPVSGRPALVLDRRAAARVLPVEAAVPLAGLRQDNAPAVLAALPGACRGRFQLLPYRAVGRDSGLLLAFRPDRAAREGAPWPGLAAISPSPVAGGRYEGLIGL